jgi:WD40 repeat protein/tRNA A-37 threonylcarbamoyl transferase component Bud32
VSGIETLDGDAQTPDGSVEQFTSVGLDTLMVEETESPGGFSDEHEDPTHIGRFVVLRRIGQGGMGVVYAAYDNELDRRLAIKLVHRARARGDHQSRVRREAQAMARLSHPNVVQVYEVGEHEQQVFVAMEWVTGPTLAEWSKAQAASPSRWQLVLDKYIEVGRGLAAAHAARLVHRDFKPANAIVGDDGRVRVLDFGIARAFESVGNGREAEDEQEDEHADDVDPLSTPLTRTGALVGTPAYMSPEQFERRSVDARSDQFSFCVALYEALYGERPFAGATTPALMFALISGEIRPAPARAEVPTWVREVLVRGLASKPDARWPSMTELLDALARDPERRRRRQLRRAVLASLVTVAVVGLVWFSRVQMRDADVAEHERELAREQEAIAQKREAAAEAERDRALIEAQRSAVRARDTARVLAAQSLYSRPDMAAALLRDTESPAQTRGWRSAAINALQRPLSQRVLRGHEGRIAYLDLTRDGRFIASASFDGTARLWPSDGGDPIVLEHDDAVISASFDFKGERLVTASRDGTAKVWRVPAAKGNGMNMPEPVELAGHGDVVWSAQFSLDGSKVVTAARDGVVRVWSLDDPTHPKVLGWESDKIAWWAEFSHDGEWVLAATGSNSALVWSLAQPEQPAMRLVGHTGNVGDARFGPGMNVIATASADGTARLYRFDRDHTGPLEAHAILDHEKEVVRVVFSPDGMRLVTVSRDMTAKLWTLDKAGELVGPGQVFEAAPDTGVVWAADFSPDGTMLALGLGDGTVQLNPIHGGPSVQLLGHTSDAFRVRFAADGQSVVSASNDGTVRVWSTDFHRAARTLSGEGTRTTALEQRGRVLVSAAFHGAVHVWPVEDTGLAPIVGEAPVTLDGHAGRSVVALDRHGRLLATADSMAPQVRVWPITGTWILDPEQPKATFETDGKAVRALAMDGEGELLAGLLSDGTLALWQLAVAGGSVRPEPAPPRAASAHNQPVRLYEYSQPAAEPTMLAFSPDGQTLAAVVDRTALGVWDRAALLSATPEQPPAPSITLPGHDERVQSLVFSPSGRRLVTTSLDSTARVWNLDAPTEGTLVLEHGYFVHAAVFDPAGGHLLTACADTNAYLWSLADPSQPTLLTGATGEIRDVEFSPDGKLAAAASMDGTLRIWPVEGGEPIELVAGASLSEVEFVDGGRRVAAAGGDPTIWLWYLGDKLEIGHLQAELRAITQVCPSASERMQFIGESLEAATAGNAACVAAL